MRVSEILSNAQRSITLIDCYVNQKVLDITTVKKRGVDFKILTKDVTPAIKRAGIDFNKQYGGLSIGKSSLFHDRFIIIDDSVFFFIILGLQLRIQAIVVLYFRVLKNPR